MTGVVTATTVSMGGNGGGLSSASSAAVTTIDNVTFTGNISQASAIDCQLGRPEVVYCWGVSFSLLRLMPVQLVISNGATIQLLKSSKLTVAAITGDNTGTLEVRYAPSTYHSY